MKKKCASLLAIILFVVMGFNVASYDLVWAVDNAAGGQTSAADVGETVEDEMKFLYIESSVLESPGTQNIVVAWKYKMSNVADIEDITKFVLVYVDSDGNTYDLESSNRTDHSVLFTKKFSSNETGTYEIKGIKYTIEGVERVQNFDFDDVEIDADFTVVNEQDDQMTDVVSDNTATTSTDVATVSDDVEAVLQTASVASVSNDGSKPVVVVIDPGHGGKNYPGACANGMIEKDLNLKIAKAFRDELSQYYGVEVYMTRETDTNVGRNDDYELTDRVLFAAGKGADLLVSVHCNSTGTGKAYGAEVWAPNQNYRYDLYQIGQAVSSKIQSELVALGLYNRGVKTKNCTDNGRYPDGSLEDYYGIIRESKENGLTGIIVEHAFIDNASDAAFLKNDNNLKRLGIADATGVAKYFGLSKEPPADPTPEEATPAAVDNALKDAGFSYAEYTAPDQEVASMRGFEPGEKVSDYVAALNNVTGISDVTYTDKDGNELGENAVVATGQVITFEFGDKTYTRNVVVAGDVNGDGKIYATDYVKIKRHIMKIDSPLSGAYKCAADVNRDAKIYATDYVRIKNHIMGTTTIDQLLDFKVYQLN